MSKHKFVALNFCPLASPNALAIAQAANENQTADSCHYIRKDRKKTEPQYHSSMSPLGEKLSFINLVILIQIHNRFLIPVVILTSGGRGLPTVKFAVP